MCAGNVSGQADRRRYETDSICAKASRVSTVGQELTLTGNQNFNHSDGQQAGLLHETLGLNAEIRTTMLIS